jgi:hypothetical protein
MTDDDKRKIADLWAQNLNKAGAAGGPPARAAAAIDVQAEFCKDWPTAKSVLEALKSILPQPGPIIIGVVIAGGDAVYSHKCGGGGGG